MIERELPRLKYHHRKHRYRLPNYNYFSVVAHRYYLRLKLLTLTMIGFNVRSSTPQVAETCSGNASSSADSLSDQDEECGRLDFLVDNYIN